MRTQTIRVINPDGTIRKRLTIKQAQKAIHDGFAEPLYPFELHRGIIIPPAKAKTLTAQACEQAPTVPSMSCEICGFNRSIERAHIIPARFGGQIIPENMLNLCPNHHTLFDRNLLSRDEMRLIWKKVNEAIQTVLEDERCESWQKSIIEKYWGIAV